MKYFTPSGFFIFMVIFYNNFIPSGLKNHHFHIQFATIRQNKKRTLLTLRN
jgi:hypothetical protein